MKTMATADQAFLSSTQIIIEIIKPNQNIVNIYKSLIIKLI